LRLRKHRASDKIAGLVCTRRFIRWFARGCKVRVQAGIHHRSSRRCGIGATRGSIDGLAERLGIRGNPETQTSAPLKDQRFGATWRFDQLAGQRSEDSGQPGDSPLAQPEGAKSGVTRVNTSRCRRCRKRGNSRPHQRRYRRSERTGQPGISPLGAPKDARFGVTRRSIAGKAGRCRLRGNPETHRRRYRRAKNRGNPGFHQRYR